MAKLFYTDKPITGLDISATGIKVMSIDPKRWLVSGYGSLDLDPVKIKESLEGESNYLAENIDLLLKEKVIGTLASNQVAISLPTAKSYSRTFTLPSKVESSMQEAVELEAEQYIPIPVGTLYIDYEVIDRKRKETTVLMSAIPKTIVDRCLAATESAGLMPILIEPSISAVARILNMTEDGYLPTVIVDIGPTNTDIAVTDRGKLRVTGGIAIGGNDFTIAISKHLNITIENAHQLKTLNGLGAGVRRDKIKEALDPSLSRIVAEIRRVMRYYNERVNSERKLEQLLIVGSGSNMPGLGDFFTNELIIAARVASPWQKLDFGKLSEPGRQFRSRYITVTGLAAIKSGEVWK